MKAVSIMIFIIIIAVIYTSMSSLPPLYKSIIYSGGVSLIFFLILNSLSISVMAFLGCFCFLTYAFILPDRSLTLAMLQHIEDKGRTRQELKDWVAGEYVRKYSVVEERINEQIISGSVYIDNEGRLQLTMKGSYLVHILIETSRILGSSRFDSGDNKEKNYGE